MKNEVNTDVIDFLEITPDPRAGYTDLGSCFYHYVIYRGKYNEKEAWENTAKYIDTESTPDEVADYAEEVFLSECSNVGISIDIEYYIEELRNL